MSWSRTVMIVATGAVAVSSPAEPAFAKMSERALAQCAVASDPVGAANFAAAILPRRVADLHRLDNASALGLRLLAACSDEAPLAKLPSFQKLHSEVAKALAGRPVVDDAGGARVLLCRLDAEVEEGQMRPFRYEIVRADGNTQVVITSQDYAYVDGMGSAPLPRDLSVRLPDGTRTARACQSIAQDGSLVDA